MIPLPPHSTVYTGSVRGYWFIAPTNFTIVGLRVSADAGTGNQFIHLMKINDPTPVLYPTASTNFTTLAYINNATYNVIQPVNIPVTTGDIIGVLGQSGTGISNSYSASATPFSATIGSFTIQLNRLLYQGGIQVSAAPNYSTEGAGTPISRVEIWYTTGPPCPTPSGLGATAITSTTATVSWGAVPGSAGYDYVVDQNAGNPSVSGTATTLTSINLNGLIPSTNYYLHVRNKCSSTSISVWVTYSFTTLPPCKPPVGFHVTNLTSVSATIHWDPWPSASNYDYIVDQSNTTPTSTTAATNTLLTSANLSGLSENTWYYVHIRSNCPGGETSNWSLDSFLTPIPCRPPVIKIDHVNTNEAVAYWDPVPTALYYEYAISTSSTPPVQGTKYNYTTIHTSALNDGGEYYFHVRSHCNSLNVESTSEWGTTSFKTFALDIDQVKGAQSIVVYPNPVTDMLHVTGIANLPYKVMDIAGRVLLEGKGRNDKETNIGMSNFARGMYILQVEVNGIKRQVNFSKQ